MRGQGRTLEQKLARLASANHGVVTRPQLLRAGISSNAVEHRLRSGALIAVHRGVYRVGHWAPSVEARYLAAVRACGEGAALSGRAAGHLLGLLKGASPPPEVTTRTERRIDGIGTRRSRHLDARDTTVFRGIPVTTVPRTLVDLAATLSFDDLARACHEAGVVFGTTPADVDKVVAGCPRAPGTRNLRRVLHGDARVTLTKLERRFLEVLKTAALPLPETNQVAGGRRVDCRWPEHRLTVELDGYRYHRSRHSWEQERRREREAYARGDDFRRYTYGDVFERPRQMLCELRGLLQGRLPLSTAERELGGPG
jgi:hypothetical protein